MPQLYDKAGGYRRMHSFTLATMIQLGTIRFCRKFVPYQEDPLGKTSGQMTGAARSGRQNLIEASERAATSKETEIKLNDVARASLAELLGDYEMFLADRECLPWPQDHPDRVALSGLPLPQFEYTEDTLHDYWAFFHEARQPFSRWLDSDDPTVVANAMLLLILKAMAMISGQLRRQGEDFVEEGGFRERMHQCRAAARDAADPGPPCPECGRAMRRRISRSGQRAGQPFWGCADYPKCTGTREIKAEDREETQDARPKTH